MVNKLGKLDFHHSYIEDFTSSETKYSQSKDIPLPKYHIMKVYMGYGTIVICIWSLCTGWG